MSKYTTEVRFICENYAGFNSTRDYNDIDDVIVKAIPKIFDNFPIFDADYRYVLCTKILRHYYTREICAETVSLWKLWLNNKMNEIMPYYNKMYKSELLSFNPFYDVDLSRQHTKENKGKEEEKETTKNAIDTKINKNGENSENKSQNNESSISGCNYRLYSDTPQGALNGVESENYLTNATKNRDNEKRNEKQTENRAGKSTNNEVSKHEATGNTNTNKDTNSTEKYLEKVSGKQGGSSYSKLLMEYRETFLNIDMMIIDELSDLFMNIW